MSATYVMIVVFLPSTFGVGQELHAPFNTDEECKAALSRIVIEEGRSGWSYCTTKQNETWFFENLDPTKKKGGAE